MPVTTVLVVDDDLDFARTVCRQLQRSGYDVLRADGLDSALEQLQQSAIDVVVTDLELRSGDGLSVLAHVRTGWPQTQTILMSGVGSARDYKMASDSGAVDFLVKPFQRAALLKAVEKARECVDGFRGTMHGLGLLELLQMYHLSRRSVSIDLHGGELEHGVVHMHLGEIIGAEVGPARGEAALQYILGAHNGTVSTSALRDDTVTIRRAFEPLLLDVLRALDEGTRSSPAPMDDLEIDGAFEAMAYDEPAPPETPTARSGQTLAVLDQACRKLVTQADGAVACGVVDVETGLLLGMHNGAQYPRPLSETVVTTAIAVFGSSDGDDRESTFEELHITSTHNYHFVKAVKGRRAVIIMVTNRNTSLGMGWAQLKLMAPSVEPLIP